MKVIESSVVGKSGLEDDCEDGILLSESFAAVIDGATDKSGRRYSGRTGGRLVMELCKSVLADLAPDVSARGAFSELTDAVDRELPGDLPLQERPSAVLAVYSSLRREIWQLGDVAFWHSGVKPGGIRQRKMVDYFAEGMRAAVISANIAAGFEAHDVMRSDPGREAILPLLRLQGVFRNELRSDEWGYGALDGRPIPDDYIDIHSVPGYVDEIVLASDGYPVVLPSLAESEARLSELLKEDPLCIGPLRATKGVQPGSRSYDDRAYVRIAV